MKLAGKKDTIYATNGYTMIELLVVATIIIFLAGLGVINYRSTALVSRDNRRQSDIEQLKVGMTLYYETYQDYPTASSVSALMANANFRQFVESTSFEDPINRSPYLYTVSSTSSGFQICYQREANNQQVCVTD